VSTYYFDLFISFPFTASLLIDIKKIKHEENAGNSYNHIYLFSALFVLYFLSGRKTLKEIRAYSTVQIGP